jgi:hypothetical protein
LTGLIEDRIKLKKATRKDQERNLKGCLTQLMTKHGVVCPALEVSSNAMESIVPEHP